MNLVKWIRKNMTKLMAVFVILIMIAFIMPGLLQKLSRPDFRRNPVMANYADGGRITSKDIASASEELSILRGLYADQFLLRQNDFKSILLGQLLFPESAQAAAVSDNLKMTTMRNRLNISPARIDDFFAQARGRSEIFWLLLKAEVESFGCGVSIESTGRILQSLIPQLTEGTMQAADLVNALVANRSVTEERVLKTFADLLTLTMYCRITTSCENTTTPQLRNIFARTAEKINAEFVALDASLFIDEQAAPGEDELQKHFDSYKGYFPGQPSEENPFGFGYKQQPKVAVEYMTVMLDDVKKLVKAPTSIETENYYQQFPSRFTEQVPQDANDTNSPMITRQKTYAEVAESIRASLLQNKINAKVMEILGDATELVEAGFENLNFETATSEDFKKAAGDYTKAAEETGKTHKIKIQTGRTALITAQDIQNNEYLGTLIIRGQSRVPIRLSTIAFAIDELGATKLGPFDIPTPKMYQNIGPMNDARGRTAAVVRIISAAEAAVPEDINLTYDKSLPKISSDATDTEDDIYSLRKIVVDDYKRSKAFETAKTKANELIKLIAEVGWDKAIEKYNERYAKDDPNAQKIELTAWNNAVRISQMEVESARQQFSNEPVSVNFINQTVIQQKLIDKFYSLLPKAEASLTNTPAIVEFKPQACYYVIKSLSRTLPGQTEYDQSRSRIAYGLEYNEGQSLALEFFMPENIIKRMNFEWVTSGSEDVNDANSTDETSGDA